MKPVEDADRQGHVTQHCPHIRTIEIYLVALVVIAPNQQCLHRIHCKVDHNQEGDGVPALHLSLGHSTVATSSQAINYHWSLNQDLDDNQKVSEEKYRLKLIGNTWTQADESIQEEAWQTKEQKHVIKKTDWMRIDIKVDDDIIGIE